jgi:hypothetical protein
VGGTEPSSSSTWLGPSSPAIAKRPGEQRLRTQLRIRGVGQRLKRRPPGVVSEHRPGLGGDQRRVGGPSCCCGGVREVTRRGEVEQGQRHLRRHRQPGAVEGVVLAERQGRQPHRWARRQVDLRGRVEQPQRPGRPAAAVNAQLQRLLEERVGERRLLTANPPDARALQRADRADEVHPHQQLQRKRTRDREQLGQLPCRCGQRVDPGVDQRLQPFRRMDRRVQPPTVLGADPGMLLPGGEDRLAGQQRIAAGTFAQFAGRERVHRPGEQVLGEGADTAFGERPDPQVLEGAVGEQSFHRRRKGPSVAHGQQQPGWPTAARCLGEPVQRRGRQVVERVDVVDQQQACRVVLHQPLGRPVHRVSMGRGAGPDQRAQRRQRGAGQGGQRGHLDHRQPPRAEPFAEGLRKVGLADACLAGQQGAGGACDHGVQVSKRAVARDQYVAAGAEQTLHRRDGNPVHRAPRQKLRRACVGPRPNCCVGSARSPGNATCACLPFRGGGFRAQAVRSRDSDGFRGLCAAPDGPGGRAELGKRP